MLHLIVQLADLYEVSPQAIKVPEIDTEVGLMHTLFALEDMYGLQVSNIEGTICLRPSLFGMDSITLGKMLDQWYAQYQKVRSNEITKEAYDFWRYNYSFSDTPGIHAKVPSQELSDYIVRALREEEKHSKE